MKIELKRAKDIADEVIRALQPLCYPGKCVAAGSIRRKAPLVGDVDIVCMPFDRAVLLARARARTREITAGPMNIIVQTQAGVQIDIFLASPPQRELFRTVPTNWGSILLCRTGSMEHNIKLCRLADRKGLHWNPCWGLYQAGQCLASETETDIFHALDLDYIEPEARVA